ncbi:MAG: DUF2249 domain-containing protein [Deltaproteobacteria bacterium]|nr:DUF2249 domain-containing protein [Deltaproteobacteria bacterium]
MEQVLDVRDMMPKDRHTKIFGTFTNLKPGESFILINDHDPKPLLYQFQAEYYGKFDWWMLEQGPQVWRVMIAKRKIDDPKRTVTEFLQTDHKRLDTIFNRFTKAVKEKNWDEASHSFREFRIGLKRHIKAEEDILFPLFEQKTGMHEGGPTAVMRMEHQDIQELLDKILQATDAKDDIQAPSASNRIVNILTDHNMKEEHILYPESDEFLLEAERSDVVKKAQLI